MTTMQSLPSYFSLDSSEDFPRFSTLLSQVFSHLSKRQTLIFLCIGTDRATGDCLGPLIGQSLTYSLPIENLHTKKVMVYGTLQQPVHAGNLSQVLTHISNHYSHPFIVAIDASLGICDHIGQITLGEGSLQPGIGVSRLLPSTGDMYITGIVNASTHNNQSTLQTTRLATVMEQAGFISKGILRALHVGTPL